VPALGSAERSSRTGFPWWIIRSAHGTFRQFTAAQSQLVKFMEDAFELQKL